MKSSTFEFYQREILTFADDTRDVLVDRHGNITFMRFNQLMSVGIKEDEKGQVLVNYNGQDFQYNTFLAKYLGNMDLMAQRILDKESKQIDSLYIDASCQLSTQEENLKEGKGLELIEHECTRPVLMGSKICFVTANAGHGKTHLLRRFEWEQARRYQSGQSNYLFLHVDLHGRDLHYLDEVIMYEIADRLHLSGIYSSSVLTLMRNGLLILGVDGFDELAAETDGEKSIGSFSDLIRKLDGQGTLIAASRRTFFNNQDYQKYKSHFDSVSEACCSFDELRLHNWGERECVEYLSYHVNAPQEEYERMLSYLHNDRNNPLLERPFLFTNIVDYATESGITPYDFLREGREDNDDEIGLERIISAFIRREVEKWNSYRLRDDRHYLTFDQHQQLLSEVAMEMWLSQRDYISVDMLEFTLSILLEQWEIPQTDHPNILKLVKSHALLVADSHGSNYRRFDHDEFRNFFLARGLSSLLEESCVKGNYAMLKRQFSIGQFQDSVAQFASKFVHPDLHEQIARDLVKEAGVEMRNTYFQPNLGIFLPFLLDNQNLEEPFTIDGRIVFSSLIFENKTLCNLHFEGCTFLNISFHRTRLTNVSFSQCVFSDISFHKESQMKFVNVVIHDDCQIAKVSVFDQNREPQYEEFAPLNIIDRLAKYGIRRDSNPQETEAVVINYDSAYRKAVKRFLNKFIKATFQYEKNLKEDPIYYSKYYYVYMEEIIPMMLRYGIIREVENSTSQQTGTRAWALKDYDLTTILQAEENPHAGELHKFWKEVNTHDR